MRLPLHPLSHSNNPYLTLNTITRPQRSSDVRLCSDDSMDYQLAERDSPDVRLCGEDTIDQRLWTHPLDGHQALALGAVVVILVDVTRQSEVADLDAALAVARVDVHAHQAVPRSDVPETCRRS